jgi:putative nucleotidyltransferase with HDIG domain
MPRVLIVDDERSIRFTLGEFLRKAEYDVETADDAPAALRILSERPFDVVVTDIVMPRVSGLALLHAIREAAPRVQVIIMTGEPTAETAAQAVRNGAFDYLFKPITKEAVLRTVANAAKIKAIDDERERLDAANREYRKGLELLVDQRTEDLREANAALQKTIEGTIRAAALIVESRDPYTGGHQQRVARLARAIADRLHWPGDRGTGLYMAGLIHDVGKIGIPAEILSKPGKLSENEMNFIRTHADVGYNILQPIAFPWPIAEIVRQHHERLDGSGYPDGMKAPEILFEARILAVADTVEAMWGHRPYRPALGIGKALEEIRRGRGAQYDPEAVDACIALFEELGFRFEEP